MYARDLKMYNADCKILGLICHKLDRFCAKYVYTENTSVRLCLIKVDQVCSTALVEVSFLIDLKLSLFVSKKLLLSRKSCHLR